MGRRSWRRWACIAMLVLLAGGVGATPGWAAVRHTKHHRAARSLTVRPLVSTPSRLLKANFLRVRLRARRRSLVRLFVLSVPTSRTAPPVVVSRIRTVRLRARRPRVVRLHLIATARDQLRAELKNCARVLVVRALVLTGRTHRPTRGYQAALRLRGVSRRCLARVGPDGLLGAGALGLGLNPRQGGASNPITNPEQGYGKCDPNNADPNGPCLEPFPNDYFTVPDPTTDTGRRVNLDITSMPANKAGKPIDPSDINRTDGYSPGAPIVVRVPGLDNKAAFDRTGAVPLTDMARAYDANQPVVLINTRTLQRQLIWTEIDANPANPANVNLLIHPGVNLPENTRYIVALRNVRDASGHVLAPSPTFAALRDGRPSSDPSVAQRRAHFEGLFNALAAAGVDRQSLYLAWDFTVASERSLSERQLSIRNDAFAQLGDTNLADLKVQGHAPAFSITKKTDFTPAQNDKLARQVEGTFTVPCYLNLPGCPSGSRFLYPPGSTHGPPMPLPGNTMTAKFTCNIPRVAMGQDSSARPTLYGHGLFGSRGEVNQGQAQSMAQEHDMVYCATDWVGMACTDVPGPPTPPGSPTGAAQYFADLVTFGLDPTSRNNPDCDIPNALSAEADLSNFPTLVDRVDQSFVNFMYLGRLLIHPAGFGANPAFQNARGRSVIDTRRLFYDGNSQGGIFGGSLIALEPDLDRGVIGVPGEDYAVLLQRSSDFGTGQPPQPNPSDPGSALPQYAYPLYQAYPNELQRPLILSLMQQMWDHSDPNGLAAHMTTDPLPNTPVHHVLMHAALGDHQVSNYAAEAEARTIGARARLPWADPGRYYERDPTYGIAPISAYPYDGSAIVMWDIGPIRPATPGCEANKGQCGTDPDPVTNTPPTRGQDPHEAPRNSVQARQMKSDFLQIGGRVTNTCGARPCYAFGWNGL